MPIPWLIVGTVAAVTTAVTAVIAMSDDDSSEGSPIDNSETEEKKAQLKAKKTELKAKLDQAKQNMNKRKDEFKALIIDGLREYFEISEPCGQICDVGLQNSELNKLLMKLQKEFGFELKPKKTLRLDELRLINTLKQKIYSNI